MCNGIQAALAWRWWRLGSRARTRMFCFGGGVADDGEGVGSGRWRKPIGSLNVATIGWYAFVP